MNLFDDLDGVGRRTLLGAHLHELSVLLLCLDEHGAFCRVVAARFLYIDMLEGL